MFVVTTFWRGLVKFILLHMSVCMCLKKRKKRSKGRISSEPRKGKSKIIRLVKI